RARESRPRLFVPSLQAAITRCCSVNATSTRPVKPRTTSIDVSWKSSLLLPTRKLCHNISGETPRKERKYGDVCQSSSVYRTRYPQRQGHHQTSRRRDRRGRENGREGHRLFLDNGRVRCGAVARGAQ